MGVYGMRVHVVRLPKVLGSMLLLVLGVFQRSGKSS